MAKTWICEKCGRANGGDLCPGCAEPRPIRVKFWYVGHPEGLKGVEDGISPGVNYLPIAILIIGPLLGAVLMMIGQASLAVVIAAVSVAGLYWLWRTLGIGPRLTFYNLIRRWKQKG